MVNSPKLVLMTPEELENLIQSSVRKAMGEQSSKSSISDDKPLTMDEASEFLQIPKPTLYAYTSTRQIPFHKMGKKILFFKADLLAWIEGGKKKTKKEIEAEGFIKMGKGGVR
jgi:excisionase family DNA binding protein